MNYIHRIIIFRHVSSDIKEAQKRGSCVTFETTILCLFEIIQNQLCDGRFITRERGYN